MPLAEFQTATCDSPWLAQVTDVQLRQFAELIYKRTGIRVSPREEAAVVEPPAAAAARDAHRRLRRVLPLSAAAGRRRSRMGRLLPGNHHPRNLSLPRRAAMGLVPQRVSGGAGRGGAAGKAPRAAADLVGRLQHRRRAGDRGLLHRRLPARPPTMADPYLGHGHRLGGASSRPRRRRSTRGPCGWCPRVIAAASL